jgi:hypothetical protein
VPSAAATQAVTMVSVRERSSATSEATKIDEKARNAVTA